MASFCMQGIVVSTVTATSYLAMLKALHSLGLYVPPCQVIAENLDEALIWVFYFTSSV